MKRMDNTFILLHLPVPIRCGVPHRQKITLQLYKKICNTSIITTYKGNNKNNLSTNLLKIFKEVLRG
jgi:hypothetical protein